LKRREGFCALSRRNFILKRLNGNVFRFGLFAEFAAEAASRLFASIITNAGGAMLRRGFSH
jgi:hypothetical protein